MKLSRVAIYVTAAILVVAAVGAGVATAHKKKIKSTVTIAWDDNFVPPYDEGDRFEGNVGSKKKKCRKDRKVKVFRTQGNQLIGTDQTNNQGRYVVAVGREASPGDYFAKAKKKLIKKNKKHKHVCKKAISPTIMVPSGP
jgi:hypothetical protein